MLKRSSLKIIAMGTVLVFAWMAVGIGYAQQAQNQPKQAWESSPKEQSKAGVQARQKSSAEDKGKSTEASAAGEAANIFEKQATDQEIKIVKKKKFPVFLVLGGVVVVGVLLYLLLKKPKYTLTVSKGTGISGSPENGSTAYTKGSMVTYSYSLPGDYKNLVVRLDGQTISSSGTIALNADHELKVTSEQKAMYKLTVTCDSNCYRIASYNPTQGVYEYQEGTEIQYSFTSTSTGGLKVLINGTLVCNNYASASTCSGSFILGQDTILMVNGN